MVGYDIDMCYRYVKSMPLITKLVSNYTKSQLLYFSYLDKDHSDFLSLPMKDGNVYTICE